MKKSDLKTGMWVENRLGKKALVLLNTKNGDIVSGPDLWEPLEDYSEDLTLTRGSYGANYDIMKVYRPIYNKHFYSGENMKLVWEREEPIEVTLEEIAKLKGVDVSRIRVKE